MVAENFLMLFAPPATPKAVIDRILAASAQAVAFPDLEKAFTASGLETARASNPDLRRQVPRRRARPLGTAHPGSGAQAVDVRSAHG